MDPITAGTWVASEGGGQAQRHAVGLGRWAFRKARLFGKFQVDWFVDGPEGIELKADDIADLEKFLASNRVRPLLSLLVTLLILEQPDSAEVEIARSALESEALRWSVDSKNQWSSQFNRIWSALVRLFQENLPAGASSPEFAEEIEDYAYFVASPVSTATNQSLVADMVELFGDVGRLLEAATLATKVADALKLQRLPAIIGHSETEGDGADFESLYVSRLLLNRATGAEEAAEDLVEAGRGFRIVLRGNPGAGKTTFVRHLTWALAQGGDDGEIVHPALNLRCREYFSRSWGLSIVEYIGAQLHSQFGLTFSTEALEAAILLGKFVVIFDGLDEITDTTARAEFVGRLEQFANRYVMTSVLVTSREVGYSRTPISESLFSQYSLREFSTEQVETYAANWFNSRNAESLIAPFLRDSKSIAEIRRNPLLLSLLCILYRARGAIPRRRREIYGRCADLLFVTWDAHRQIEQPEELPAYGGRLMQEIARWVYKSTAAQGGLEEQIIEKVIRLYLEGVGVPEDQARIRSREFLEFCAGRAWLLGVQGTSEAGQRIFGFTHRTFYEYFAAEALSRGATSVDDLYDEMAKAHNGDSTSVLPELLIQAYEERVESGALDVFKLACRNQASPALILRLMNGSLLSANVRRHGFDELVRQWKSDRNRFDSTVVDALFTLDPNTILQFRDEYVAVSEDALSLLVAGWAYVGLIGQQFLYSADLNDAVEKAVPLLTTEQLAMPVVNNWMVAKELAKPKAGDVSRYVALRAFGRPVPGAFWDRLMWHISARVEELDSRLLKWISDAGKGGKVTRMAAIDLSDITRELPGSVVGVVLALGISDSLNAIEQMWVEGLLTLGMIHCEVASAPTWASLPLIKDGASLELLLDARLEAMNSQLSGGWHRPIRELTDSDRAELARLLSRLPDRFAKWTTNEFRFVGEPSVLDPGDERTW